ncbi:MAG: ABC-ATPase domain-containing protein [bacterium]|nr:ABC-ATPase domain-containing protein [bacterium]
MERLRSILKQIDGRGYKAYKDIKGLYRFAGYTLSIDHVQGDPFALATRLSIRIDLTQAAFPDELFSSPIRKTAFEDFLGRSMAASIRSFVKGQRGTGKSGEIRIEAGGQQVLLRNAFIVSSDAIEARLTAGLPADGRKVLAEDALEMFFSELPGVVGRSLYYKNCDAVAVKAHVESVEDQEYLRNRLAEKKLVSFLGDGSLLPRNSGIDDRPLKDGVVGFISPESLSLSLTLPNRGEIRGMGIPEGVTLIVGGGFHGKSTLLHAIERGVYNHIPGDGRELVVTDPGAVKIRAEDGRYISEVDISPFIDNLPFGRDTKAFTTENASGSTSQAANIIEALECGSRLLLIDEDTCATNFMIRDERMQSLVAKDKEPITPLVRRVRELYDSSGISTVIVMGGSGDYFEVSDRVIMMDSYEAKEVTVEAHSIAGLKRVAPETLCGTSRLPEFFENCARRPGPQRLDASRGSRDVKIDAADARTLNYGKHRVDLSSVEQLIDIGQTRSIGLLIHYYAENYASKTLSLVEGLKLALKDVDEMGLDVLSPYKVGNLALPRLHELAAAVNRIRPGN